MHGDITMKVDLEKLIKSLGDGYTQKVIKKEGAIIIGTPFLDSSNDGIEVYAYQMGETIVVTDDGWTFALECDFTIEHTIFLRELLKNYPSVNVKNGREIVLETKKETFVQDFYVYMSALMHLIGFFEYGERWREWHDKCCDEEE